MTLIPLLSLISILEGNSFVFNKRPGLNKCPGQTFWPKSGPYLSFFYVFHLFWLYFFENWVWFLQFFQNQKNVLSLISMSWEEISLKIIRMSWTAIRVIRVQPWAEEADCCNKYLVIQWLFKRMPVPSAQTKFILS